MRSVQQTPEAAPKSPGVQTNQEVEVSVDGRVLWVTVNRPQKRNALSLAVLERLGAAFSSFADDDRIHVAVLTGAGERAFAAGGDLDELDAIRDVDGARKMSLHGKRALDAIRYFPTPVVALMNGTALGGGAELALACDLRIAAPHATFGLIHARLAITPAWGGSVDLMQLTGYATATRLLARGDILTSGEAHALGLVEHVLSSDGSLLAQSTPYIEEIAKKPRQVLTAIKAATISQRRAGRAELEELATENFVRAWVHADHWAAVKSMRRAK
jgi:enoyl-CoA hydratase